jgi:CheY-like chemotaxis protein
MEEMIRRILGPEIRLDLRLGDGQWNVICDASQLESALLNLSINARDAMPLGGVLRIATTDRKLAANDLPGQEIQPGNYVEIEVADNGRGMGPETLARAFEPFFTTKPSGQGTGLGLSQTYGFVTQSGGALLIESTLGEGTTVRIYMPGHERTREPAPLELKPTAKTIDSTGAALPHRRVLVVEDQDAVRFQIAAALNEIECTTIQAGDGQKGLELLQSGESLDLLITDVGMPGLNGRELADAARAIQPDLPILFITGYAGKVLDSLQFAPGMDVLRKPFSLDELVDRVRALLAPAAAQKSL